ncbi:flagellar motor stator protein MotA [Bermanella marisrubri]|uniref:Flagellar motor component n=1 Tax=Bermanella marisrubri TaxID=207949 RepID=Q1N255_9GAMM|nr:flagellar motor stator protein MotA [Bermanella marisrubri]EAT12309.1 Flagellar motor component [Bermanella marisrubri]QIZ85397.1 flagellar motor stator protein MotA [Bermanella marisrubri]
MLFFIGMAVVICSVIFGYLGAHGVLLALWQPYEFIIILGSGIGAHIVSNPGGVHKDVFKMLPQVITGGKANKAMHMDCLSLIYDILNKSRKEGMMSIEADVENPQSSGIFSKYPAIQQNHHLADFIADYFRLIAAGNMQAHELDALMDMEIDTRMHELSQPGSAIQKIADAMPGFGIVAAVLGIVITMGAIDGPMEEIGKHIAAALVGTFSGVLFGYGFFGPIASKMEHIAHEEIKLYESAKATIVASVNGLPPQLAVEFGRKVLFAHDRPTFSELESKVRAR